MSHNEFKQMIQLSLYGELSEEKQKILLLHLESCEECRAEIEHQKNLMSIVADHKNLDVNEQLLKEARLQLRGGLRMEKNNRSLLTQFSTNIIQTFSTTPRLAFGAVSILVIGILIGSVFFKNENLTAVENESDFSISSLMKNELRISNMRFTDPDPGDGEVEFTFDAVKPVYFKGSVNDPKIQSILTYAMLNDQNPGSRLNSINAMDSYGKLSVDKDIKDALVTVVMTDNNPGVRREAIKLLDRVSYDESLKQAYLFVLLNDSSSALRIEALNALIESIKKGHTLNQNDVKLVIQQASHDDNNYIRLKSKTLIEEYN